MIVVTGASGVIGRALIARLHTERLPCRILDRNVLAAREPLISAVSCKPSVLVHLAAVVPQPPKTPDDEVHAAHTRDMDARVLDAVRQWGCHAVYASGCSLYEKKGKVPNCEAKAGTERVPSSPYLAAKQKGERDFLASGLATVLRISAPIGEGIPPATVIGRFIEKANAEKELEVWGSGRREQNYLDVMDIADALFRVLIVRPCELINIAADKPITMLELAQEVVEICGRGVVTLSGRFDPRDGESASYSNQLAADLMGWYPRISIRTSLKSLCGGAL